MLHAWDSAQMRLVAGVGIYARADGSLVEVTCVSETPEHGLMWDDVVYLGEVESFVSASPQHQLELNTFYPDVPIDWDDEEEQSS